MNIGAELARIINKLLQNPLALLGLGFWILLVLVERKWLEDSLHPVTNLKLVLAEGTFLRKAADKLFKDVLRFEIIFGLAIAALIHFSRPAIITLNGLLICFVFFTANIPTALHLSLLTVVAFEIVYFTVRDNTLRVVLISALVFVFYLLALG